MRRPACSGEFERGSQQVTLNLSEGTSRWWGIWARGPTGGGEFERGVEQVVGNLSGGTSRWWGI